MKRIAAASLVLLPIGALAQTTVAKLWPNGAPGSENWTQKEIESNTIAGFRRFRNVVDPSITGYLPFQTTATGAAAIVAPGGAFRVLAFDTEGTTIAEWLRQHGVAAFVLKYRLANTGTAESYTRADADAAGDPPPEIQAMAAADALRAIEIVRQRATEWRVDPAKIGIIGFSAGGYVALQTALHHTSANRPAFVGAIYASYMDAAKITVPDDAPPTFFLHAYNDPMSDSTPSLYLAWKAAAKPAELHSYADGGHAFGMPMRGRSTDNWIERFGDWLRYQKLLR
ncbi:MAG TPA: alpha/beta hydrolase [Bryobacteraceae bacterium]|jgi:acetyl esterase/lipase